MSQEERSSLEKGLALLQQLSAAESPMLVSELATAAGLNRATAYRLCEVLERNGWLLGVESGSRRQFHLGSTALGFAVLVASRFGIEERIQPLMDSLADRVGETVHAGFLDGSVIVHVANALPSSGAYMALPLGARVDAHITALGKALLATLSRDDLLARYPVDDLAGRTASSIRSRAQLLEELDRVRAARYAIDDEESGVGVRCIAAPVFVNAGHALAAISVTTMPVRLEGERLDAVAREVQATAASATGALGGIVPPEWQSESATAEEAAVR
jgi:IclR family transcriptional regulator, acetate operon repressor